MNFCLSSLVLSQMNLVELPWLVTTLRWTKVDMAKGYYQVPMDKESVPLTGFVTPFGFFRWKYMPFGLRNAPATFSRLVHALLYGMETFCVAYLDDILIFSETWSDHLKHLNLVFTRVREAKLTLKLSKCEFAAAELDFLGHYVGLGKLLPREQKVKALIDFPRPVNRKGVQRFLGLAGYFRRFIPHYSDLSRVLSDLLKKNTKYVWTDVCEQAFVDIKSRLASRPILRPPNYNLPFCMAVDASDMAVGACLFQVIDGFEHPICYLSKKLNKHQLNYSTVEKEALVCYLQPVRIVFILGQRLLRFTLTTVRFCFCSACQTTIRSC